MVNVDEEITARCGLCGREDDLSLVRDAPECWLCSTCADEVGRDIERRTDPQG
jgi:hypothetical protein